VGGGGDLKADGTVPLTAEWITGNFNIKGLSTIYVGSSAPSSPYASMLWQDTTVATRFLLKRWSGSAWINVYRSETVTRTINVDNGMSTAEIQAEIDNLGRNILAGVTVTVQFADGTYTLTDALNITGFYGGGILEMKGNAADNTLSTTKAVYLDFGGQVCEGFNLFANTVAAINVNFFKIRVNTGSSNMFGIKSSRVSGFLIANANYFLGTGTAYGYGTYVSVGKGLIINCYFYNIKIGVGSVYVGDVRSQNNDDVAAIPPAYGLHADGGLIFKKGTQPAGSVANELKTNGGQIW